MEIFNDPKSRKPSEVPLLIGKNDKMIKEIELRPKRSIMKIIKKGVKYFQEHPMQLVIEDC